MTQPPPWAQPPRPPAPWPPYAAPPPAPPAPKRRWLAPVLVGAGVIVLALIAGLALVVPKLGGSAATFDAGNPQADQLQQAAYLLSRDPATHYTGTLGDGSKVDLEITSTGSTSGTVTDGGTAIKVMATKGRTFIKAPKSFWTSAGSRQHAAALYAKQWVKVDPDKIGLDVSGVLAPAKIGATLVDVAQHSDVRDVEHTSVDGTPALRLATSDGDVYVTASRPYTVLRISTSTSTSPDPTQTAKYGGGARVVPVGPQPGARFDLFVQKMPQSAVDDLIGKLKDEVDSLKNSIDSTVSFSLDGDISLAPCGQASCTATLSLSNQISSSDPRLKANQDVTAEVYFFFTLDGEPIGDCEQSVTMSPNGEGTAECSVGYALPADGKTHQIMCEAEATAKAVVQADIKSMADDLANQSTAFQLRNAGRYGLPGWKSGDGPYVFRPGKDYRGGPLRPTSDGYKDEYGNTWEEGPAHGAAFRKGFTKEWDVQLSRTGVNMWGEHAKRAAGGGWYLNVCPDGTLSH